MSFPMSLYRAYIRQVKALPHHYLRIKGADDFRSLLKTKSVQLRKNKLKRVSKDLQRLRAANQGQSTAFDRVLDIAYGRVGKLRHELMEPLLLNPHPARKERFSTPVYSPELTYLLTSGISHTTRALHKHRLASPPGFSERANPNSQDAKLLGPLSRRRECNMHWRFFKSEWKKVYPPLEISSYHPSSHGNATNVFGFQKASILQELLVLAGSDSKSTEPSGRHGREQKTFVNPFDGNLPVRWLRRRYQALLGRIPLLVLKSSPQDDSERTYDVQLANNAMTSSKPNSSRLRVVDTQDTPWISDIYPAVQPRRHRK